jgi:hypothetical protein
LRTIAATPKGDALPNFIRFGPVVVAALGVAAAGWAGLGRIAVVPALGLGGAGEWHGALMVTAIATFIAVERATVIQRQWVWAAPSLSAIGLTAIVVGVPMGGASLVIAASAAIVVFVMARGAAATPGLAIALMTAGAVAWLVAALLLVAGTPVAHIVPWWSAFLVLTIAGERHELARMLRPSQAALVAFAFPVALYAIGTALTLVDLGAGSFAAGVAEVALAAWLIARDRPLRASRAHPLSRFIAAGTRIAYVWLAVAGLLLALGRVPAGLWYDAELHALFAGFVLTMIVAHAPIILPAITGRMVTFRGVIYAPLALLTLSVAVRIAGDLTERPEGRAVGAAGTGVALLLFAATMATALRPRRLGTTSAIRGGRVG